MGLRMLRIIIVGVLPLMTCLAAEAQSEHGKNIENPVEKDNRNPHSNMASFPYVYTSRLGGYPRYDNGKVGMNVGMERNCDAFRKTWQNVPIVTPAWHVTKGFDIELPFGHLMRQGQKHIIDHNRSPR
jgi:hypothetical protein